MSTHVELIKGEAFKMIKPMSLETAEKPSKGYYPSLHLSHKDLPIAKTWKIGDDYELMLKVRQVSTELREGSDGSSSFEIRGIRAIEHKPMINEEKKQKAAATMHIDEDMPMPKKMG